MQILPFSNLFFRPTSQARSCDDASDRWRISELACELAGLVGLLAWLGVLFCLIALFATRPA
jgi:hypothetical protein